MVLTLLRHAAPSAEYHRRYIGHTDIPVDPSLFYPVTLPFSYDAVYSSDLLRCTQTLEHLGYTDAIIDSRLREVRFKEQFEGKNFDEIEQMGSYTPDFLESQERWHDFVCEEPIGTFRSRIESFLGELPADQNILICTHAGTIREILSLLCPNLPPLTPGYLEHTIVRIQ